MGDFRCVSRPGGRPVGRRPDPHDRCRRRRRRGRLAAAGNRTFHRAGTEIHRGFGSLCRRNRRALEGSEMQIEIEIDVEVLKSEIKKTYASVSEEPARDFIFPTGRAWAEDLEYPEELANVPDSAVESFAGVANPFSL